MTFAGNRTIVVAFLISAALLAGGAATAAAQGAVLSDDDDEAAPEPVAATTVEAPDAVHYGIGLRLRNVRLPESMLELFVEDAPGGGSNLGIGIEGVRRRGNFELAIGLEYDSLAAGEGVWIDKGDTLPGDEPDLVKFNGFGWIAADISFVWQQPIIEQLALRYGAGIGLGFFTGAVERTDYRCSSADTTSCSPTGTAPRDNEGLPPVFPLINLTVGVQVRPTANIAINIEGGLRTVPFFGTTIAYYF